MNGLERLTTIPYPRVYALACSIGAVGLVTLVAGAFAPVNDGIATTLLLLSMAVNIGSAILLLYYMYITGKRPPKT